MQNPVCPEIKTAFFRTLSPIFEMESGLETELGKMSSMPSWLLTSVCISIHKFKSQAGATICFLASKGKKQGSEQLCWCRDVAQLDQRLSQETGLDLPVAGTGPLPSLGRKGGGDTLAWCLTPWKEGSAYSPSFIFLPLSWSFWAHGASCGLCVQDSLSSDPVLLCNSWLMVQHHSGTWY